MSTRPAASPLYYRRSFIRDDVNIPSCCDMPADGYKTHRGLLSGMHRASKMQLIFVFAAIALCALRPATAADASTETIAAARNSKTTLANLYTVLRDAALPPAQR